MYLEDLAFCIKRAGWKVTKIHAHLTFEQSRFKRNFVLMNQKSRQLSKNDLEKDFFKLMNNSNFGYDCRNNLDNCKFNPISDELGETTYVNRYHNIFDEKVYHEEIKKIYQKYKINKCLVEQNLTDTDSTSIFLYSCGIWHAMFEKMKREILFSK